MSVLWRFILLGMLWQASAYAVIAEPKIIHGSPAYETQVPWQVALFFTTATNKTGYICSGTLIDAQWVLTAAHCINLVSGRGTYHAVVGAVNLNELDDTQIIKVSQTIVHPAYQASLNLDNDIALLKLEQPVDLQKCAASCQSIPWLDHTQSALATINSNAQVAGWGRLQSEANDNSSNPYPAVLQVAPFRIVACPFSNYQFDGKTWPLSSNMFCASGANNNLPADTCEGDSGAGLVVNTNTSRPMLAGITSWGEKVNCGERKLPGVYTRVSNYDDWILSYINPTAYAERIKLREQQAAQQQAQQASQSSSGGSVSLTVILGLLLLVMLRHNMLKLS